MNTIYPTRAEAEDRKVLDPSLDDYIIVECKGGFKFVERPVDNFLAGEPIPPEVKKKPKPPRNSHNKTLDDDCGPLKSLISKYKYSDGVTL